MKLMGLDWKFFTSIVVALAGLALPLHFSQAELNAHSLTVHLVSSSALEAPPGSKIDDLEVTVNGSRIESPHILSLVLVNNGSKPIASSDFETPLVLATRNKSKLITAQITRSEPEGIPAQLLIEDGKLKILPFLSNPNDQIEITLVSSGAPDLVTTARIAGVKNVVYEDMTTSKQSIGKGVLSAVLLLACMSMYVFFFSMGGLRHGVRVGVGVRLITVICLAFGGTMFGLNFMEVIGNDSKGFATLGLLVVIAIGLGIFLSKRNERRYGY